MSRYKMSPAKDGLRKGYVVKDTVTDVVVAFGQWHHMKRVRDALNEKAHTIDVLMMMVESLRSKEDVCESSGPSYSERAV